MFKTSNYLRTLAASLLLAASAGCADTAAPPPKAVMASPEVTGPELAGAWYQVYFDTDKFEIDPRGQMIVKNVAYVVANAGPTRVTVIGKTDTVGSQSKNMTLSKRRANMVRDSLIAAGVPAGHIDTRWTGEGTQDATTGNDTEQQLDRVVDVIVVKQSH